MAGDGGSFGKVAADKSVGIFVCSSLPGAMGVSEEHLHAGILGEALVAGHFPPPDPMSVFASLPRVGPGCGG